jgi:hypothetical protein
MFNIEFINQEEKSNDNNNHSVLKDFENESVVFVYGSTVDDFHTLNKDAIWTVATAALQEVDRQLQSAKETIATHEETIASQQAKIDALVARLDAAGIP